LTHSLWPAPIELPQYKIGAEADSKYPNAEVQATGEETLWIPWSSANGSIRRCLAICCALEAALLRTPVGVWTSLLCNYFISVAEWPWNCFSDKIMDGGSLTIAVKRKKKCWWNV
jgi:hypothetical protein